MFAVKGWAVSANGLQTQTKSPSNTDGEAAREGNTAVSSGKSKKRKQGSKKDENVTAENLAELYAHHIERNEAPNKDPKVGSKRPKRGKKRSRSDLDTTSSAIPGDRHDIPYHSLGKQETKRRKQEIDHAKTREAGRLSDHQQKQRVETSAPIELVQSEPQVLRPSAPPTPAAKLTPLQSSMRQKLISSRFRHLNETLYTTHSKSSSELFKQNPTFFSEYHEGFRRQVTAWPENPVDGFIRWIRERGAAKGKDLGSQKAKFRKENKLKGHKSKPESALVLSPEKESLEPLPRNPRTGLCTIADLGCGDAQLAETLTKSPPHPSTATSLKLRIHSYDLASTSPLVTVADISSIPLADSSVDVAIISLALMGTNWIEFIEEAYRILRWKGECWISEVNSRFASPKNRRVEHSVGNRRRDKDVRKSKRKGENVEADEGVDEDLDTIEPVTATQQAGTDVSAFVSVLHRRGFVLQGEPELGNKMFVRMRFLKSAPATTGKGAKPHEASGFKAKKFLENDSSAKVSLEDEARALKPCVYKTR